MGLPIPFPGPISDFYFRHIFFERQKSKPKGDSREGPSQSQLCVSCSNLGVAILTQASESLTIPCSSKSLLALKAEH